MYKFHGKKGPELLFEYKPFVKDSVRLRRQSVVSRRGHNPFDKALV